MYTAVQTSRPPAATASPWQALRDLVRGLARRWELQRDYARARFEFQRVDAATLRDVGMTRSEFGSFWAESRGLTEPTRVRVLRSVSRQDPH